MKPLAYFLNLAYTVAFIYSIVKVSDNPAPLWVFTLVASTIVLTTLFLTHCYTVTDKE
jgi:hypothetical protein